MRKRKKRHPSKPKPLVKAKVALFEAWHIGFLNEEAVITLSR